MAKPFEQPPRQTHSVRRATLLEFIADLEFVTVSTSLDMNQVIAAARVLEMRRANDLAVDDADAKDEDRSGFAAILERIARALQDTAERST